VTVVKLTTAPNMVIKMYTFSRTLNS